jgi:hypothetical protein
LNNSRIGRRVACAADGDTHARNAAAANTHRYGARCNLFVVFHIYVLVIACSSRTCGLMSFVFLLVVGCFVVVCANIERRTTVTQSQREVGMGTALFDFDAQEPTVNSNAVFVFCVSV